MNRKELINNYKNRVQIGGVFAIKNTFLNKWYVDFAVDLTSAKNRFEFMGASYYKIAADYAAQNGESFIFEVVEELIKDENQSEKEFMDDLAVLKSIWLEKLADQNLY